MSRNDKRNTSRIVLPPLGFCVAALMLAQAAEAGVYEVDSVGTAADIEIKGKLYSAHSVGGPWWDTYELSLGGPVTGNLEWGIASSYGDLPRGDGSPRGGWRDLSVATKWQFLDHSAEGGIAMAIEPAFTFPIGSASTGTGSFVLPLRLARRFGPVYVTGQVGLEYTFGDGHESIDAGVLTEYAVSDELSYGIEFVADAPREQPHSYHFRGNVGLTWEPNGHVVFQMLAGRTLDNRRGAPETVFSMVLEYHR